MISLEFSFTLNGSLCCLFGTILIPSLSFLPGQHGQTLSVDWRYFSNFKEQIDKGLPLYKRQPFYHYSF
jgi:hypothetical protein